MDLGSSFSFPWWAVLGWVLFPVAVVLDIVLIAWMAGARLTANGRLPSTKTILILLIPSALLAIGSVFVVAIQGSRQQLEPVAIVITSPLILVPMIVWLAVAKKHRG
jgi:hypothetical protein